MNRISLLVLLAVCAGACGHDQPNDAPPDAALPDASASDASPADAGPGDAGSDGDGATGDSGADIATTLQCGKSAPVGPGNAPEFQLATIDASKFPDALCNDGTPAVLYFRPYNGDANRDKWLINLHGGGSCASGPSCAARWCSCDDLSKCPFADAPTNFDRSTMTDARAPMKSADGLDLRGGTGAQTNPLGDYNQVELTYCSSDAWHGGAKGVSMTAPNPKTGVPVTFTIDFLGAKILDGDLAWLRQDGVPGLVYTLGGASVAMPDLDDASQVIVTGDSAGGAGVIQSLDYIADLLKAHNTNPSALQTYGLLDAIVGIDRAPLDYGTYWISQVRSYDDYLTLRSMSPSEAGARVDASCLAVHAADPRICRDESHVADIARRDRRDRDDVIAQIG
jgi:hypothetical protein